jgi:pimeloyl-ACP methyl ester carboxylesterase
MYDYEGYGLSGGTPSLATLNRDLKTVVDWTRAHTGRTRVTLMGLSLGSIPSVAVAVERPEAVNGVILDSPIAMRAEIERFGFLLIGGADALLPQLDRELLSEAMISSLRQPLLVFLHEEDSIASPETVEPLFKAAAGPKTMVRFAGLGHATSQFQDTDTYLYYLDTFLTGVWREEAAP